VVFDIKGLGLTKMGVIKIIYDFIPVLHGLMMAFLKQVMEILEYQQVNILELKLQT